MNVRYIKYGLASFCAFIIGIWITRYVNSLYDDYREGQMADACRRLQRSKQPCKRDVFDYDEVVKINSKPLPDATYRYKLGTVCQEDDRKNCVVKYQNISNDPQFIYVLEKAKSVVCTIPKNLSMLLSGLVCLLHDELSFLYERKDIFLQDFLTESCKNQRVNFMEEAIERFNASTAEDWSFLSVTRDPVDRFISAYLYTCVNGVPFTPDECTRYCFDCGADLACFVDRAYEEIMKMSRGERNEFEFALHHIYPQTWRCNFEKLQNNFTLIDYGSDAKTIDQLYRYFEPRNVSTRALQFVSETANSKRTTHSTINSQFRSLFDKRLRSSPYLLEKIYRIYHHDFSAFGYLPPSVQEKTWF